MRHYEADSSRAVARILSMTMLIDGWLDNKEVDSLRRSGIMERHGIADDEFDAVLQEYCDDLMQSEHYVDAIRLRLAPETVEALLCEICCPIKRSELLATMHEIARADGLLTSEEASLLGQAMACWQTDLNCRPN
jgi:uncharacterized tellurite resistance protein B-like protein